MNCKCCKNNPDGIVDKDIIKDCLIEKEYCICQLNKEGAFPKKLRIFKEERFSQKRTGNKVKRLALKILINGGYGVFGNRHFKYADLRIAELITAFGRYTLIKMQEIAKDLGFEIVYGDTDSLFLHSNSDHTSMNDLQNAISKLREEECKLFWLSGMSYILEVIRKSGYYFRHDWQCFFVHRDFDPPRRK